MLQNPGTGSPRLGLASQPEASCAELPRGTHVVPSAELPRCLFKMESHLHQRSDPVSLNERTVERSYQILLSGQSCELAASKSLTVWNPDIKLATPPGPWQDMDPRLWRMQFRCPLAASSSSKIRAGPQPPRRTCSERSEDRILYTQAMASLKSHSGQAASKGFQRLMMHTVLF